MFTFYYVGATFFQAWKIKSVCNKIGEQLMQQSSVAFYNLPANHCKDGFDPEFATSERCRNRNTAKVTDILWLNNNQRGCALRPHQYVHIRPWITFPTNLDQLVPFAREKTPEELLERLAMDTDHVIHLLLETELQPNNDQGRIANSVKLENYGKLIAWKVDSHLAVLLETDIEHFTKLLISTFLQSNCFINDNLALIRIESIIHEGHPQIYEMVANHLKKSARTSQKPSDNEWQKHLEGLRALSVLAHQATEFEYNKNLTEGKTGVVKPDLIPTEKKHSSEKSSSSTKSISSPAKISEIFGTPSKISTTDSKASTPTIKTLSKEKSPSKDANELKASSTQGLTKLKPKPTEIKKFSSDKMTEQKSSPTKLISPPQTKLLSEVETETKTSVDKQKSPINSSTSKPISPSKVKKHVFETLPKIPTLSNLDETSTFASSSSNISVHKNNAQRPVLKRNKDKLGDSKPLNILVYSDSISARESTVSTLQQILEKDRYTIYALTPQQAAQKFWFVNTALLIVCGNVPLHIGEILVNYFLRGGHVLSLCSDILHFVLPNYRTAEVREHELVQFSYDKWQKVKMMHHIFCYQPSPVKKNFSVDGEESTGNSMKPALVCPRSIELKDLNGESHSLDVKVLGTEETWNTPSLLLANSTKTAGKAVFSQVHLEASPSQFEADEHKVSILRQNEHIRLEIFSNLLSKYLNMSVNTEVAEKQLYQNAYFLGHHESKFELLSKIQPQFLEENTIATSKITLKFCGKSDIPPQAVNNVLPILIHSCPEDFSTVEYFENLKTKYLGRLMIYAPIISSSMNVINELELTHGLAVLARQQTQGEGRSNNQWLSPYGCAMFSIQLHLAMDSRLGQRLPLIQHIIGAAMVNTLRGHEVYKHLDIALKWPNDVYANGITKIGGLIVKTTILGNKALLNIGCGINLDNGKPTLCINDMISEFNVMNEEHLNIPKIKYEQFIALMFNEIERLVELVQIKGFEQFYLLYYELWLHGDQVVTICDKDGQNRDAEITGIDDYGFLKVKLTTGDVKTVQPDGNSFDMLKGLIVPKFN